MDTNVLAEQRRETVINLLKGMKIKKTDGDGFDKDDVYLCMQQLCDVYEKSIEDLTANYDGQIAELQEKYQKYDENNELYISLIMEAKKSSNEIITKAKAEVDEIIANGKEQIAKQEEELEQLKKTAEAERIELQAAGEKARADADKEKAAIAEEVNAELARAEEAKAVYKRRLEAMETEFDEIKTNILRTAGKIDGLKAQLNEQTEDSEWKIQDTPGRIDVPEADIAVEEAVEVDAPAFESSVPTEAPIEAPAATEIPVAVEAPFAAEAVAEVAPEANAAAKDDEWTFDDLVARLQSEEPAAGASEAVETAVEAKPVEVELPDMSSDIEIPLEQVELPTEQVELPAEQVEVPIEEALNDLDQLEVEELEIELPDVEAPVEETPIEEISFEGLEELFKE